MKIVAVFLEKKERELALLIVLFLLRHIVKNVKLYCGMNLILIL